jgi:hypothetical protein
MAAPSVFIAQAMNAVMLKQWQLCVQSIAVCRTEKDGYECGTIKLELYSRRGFYL